MHKQIDASPWESRLWTMMEVGRAYGYSVLREPLALLGIAYLGQQFPLTDRAGDPQQFLLSLITEIEHRNNLQGQPLSRSLFSRFQGIAPHILSIWLQTVLEHWPNEGFSYWFSSKLDELGFEHRYDTPSSVSQLVASIFSDRSPSSVFDPACGTGGLLAAVAERFGRATILGQEISTEAYAWAQLRFLVLGLPNVTLLEGNALNDPARDHRLLNGGFDMILTNPPFGHQVDAHGAMLRSRRLGIELTGRLASETAYVNKIADCLSGAGVAAVVVPNGFLSRAGTDQKLRQALITSDILHAIIGLPERLFAPATAIGTAILILNRQKSDDERGRALFVEARGLGDRNGKRATLADDVIERIRSRYCEWANEDGFSQIVSFKEFDSRNLSFSPGTYVRQSVSVAKMSPCVRRARILELDEQHSVLCKQYETLRSKLDRSE
jgi:type I restriction-modification system DNA methylase subunit